MDEASGLEAAKVVAGEAGQHPAWDDPRIPWSGKPRRVDILCWAGIMLSGIFYWVTLPLRTHLVGTHPVVSELIGGGTESIISAAAFARVGHGSLVVVLLAAIPGLMKFDPLYWWAGRSGGSASSRCSAASATAGPSTWDGWTGGAASSPGPP